MTNEEQIDGLVAEIARGRGLWIGAFPDPAEHLLDLFKVVHRLNEQILADEEIDPRSFHVTLAHLGKQRSRRDVAAVSTAATAAASLFFGVQNARIEAIARMSNVVCVMLGSEQIDKLGRDVRLCLSDRQVLYDQTFGWTPHVTIARLKRGESFATIPGEPSRTRSLIFRGVTIVCGDARLDVPFASHPF